ncbi:hypothetical protein [Agrococcus sp. HG114]|uniref:hypothetical protein n=1 Tax=Agrococcus sp. HG114 TaxID=2969757 RepID=UPI00215A9AA8|nr:hypothetical protein [Agrococcus sp. HG114]MCR8670503.1 hypothetical protein [Agrococcus sp. HG114]
MDHEGTPDEATSAIERSVRRAARIGRIAADEDTPHGEAHRIARATAVLAATEYARDAARARVRRSPFLHAFFGAIVLVPIVTAFLPGGRGLSIFSILTLLYGAMFVAEVTVGSPVHRIAHRLPFWAQQLVSPNRPVFEHAVLRAYDARSAELGRAGCSCGVHDDAP